MLLMNEFTSRMLKLPSHDLVQHFKKFWKFFLKILIESIFPNFQNQFISM